MSKAARIDPSEELAGVGSCVECGAIVRHMEGRGLLDLDLTRGRIAGLVGPSWELTQGYGLGRATPHADACPPGRGLVELAAGALRRAPAAEEAGHAARRGADRRVIFRL